MQEKCARQTPPLIRVLVASSCPAMLEGLASILERGRHVELVGRELDCDGALCSAVKLKPDVTVLDWHLDGSHSSILVHVIRTRHRLARIVILSDLNKDREIVPALRCGAVGYIDRNSTPEEIVTCVERVHGGHRHLAPLAAMRLTASVHSDGLTVRERQLVELLGKSRTNREIAASLRISESTVQGHLTGLFLKLNARNRTEAIEVAIECGLLAPRLESDGKAGLESASIN
jgi:DNA-binding NarL/FixJ family response regulator